MRVNSSRGSLGHPAPPRLAAHPLLTIISLSILQAALLVFSLVATSLDSLVRSSALAPPHAMALCFTAGRHCNFCQKEGLCKAQRPRVWGI